ncbi:MAG: GatB/YqeY domain-containing protein [Clostridia bacterium]|nr:GatB/YqeY domain-containing protein [Clostridia bacterium]
MLYDDIKKANVEAMKNKDTVARSFYSVLLNKILLESINKREKGEEIVDADVSNIIQKMIKELNEEKENYSKVGNTEQVDTIVKQIEIASKYLPKMLTEEEIATIIASLEDKSIGNVMKHFKTNYNGTVDMRLVQEVLKRG